MIDRRFVFRAGAAAGLAACGLAGGLASGLARAQGAPAAAASPLKALGLFPVLGDAIDVSLQEDPAATRMDRARREVLAVPNIGFDRLVAAEVRRHMTQALPAVFLHAFGVPTLLTVAQQRQMADDARRGALPGFVLDRVQEQRLSHVLLVTRDRVPTSVVDGDGVRFGRGEVEGLGFYLDPTHDVRDPKSGYAYVGVLAPHVVARLTLLDVEAARVVGEAQIDLQRLVGPKPQAAGTHPPPWDYIDAAEKVMTLRGLLQSGLRAELPKLLPAAVR